MPLNQSINLWERKTLYMVYHNRIVGHLVVDLTDYYLLTAFISIHLIQYLKYYFLEKEKVKIEEKKWKGYGKI
jgi:hypothetical protein